MKIRVFYLLLLITLGGCTTNYSVQNINKYDVELKQSYNLNITCKSYKFDMPKAYDNFCEEDGFTELLTSTSPKALKGEITIKKTSYFSGVSPGMILLLGLIPATSYKEYSLDIHLVSSNRKTSSKHSYKLIEKWSSWNTILKLFGAGTTKKEAIQFMLVDAEEKSF